MCDELDLEDLESMLYSQVYHVSSEYTDANINSNNNANNNDVTGGQDQSVSNHITLKSKRQNSRYFHAERDNLCTSNSSIYISIEQNGKSGTPDTPINAVENTVPVETNGSRPGSTENFAGQFQNNITINQYNIPVIFNPEVEGTQKVVSNRYKRYLERKKRKQEKQKAKRRANREAKRNIERNIDQANMSCVVVELNENANLDATEQINNVICLSEDSDSECVIIQDTECLGKEVSREVLTGFPKKYNEDDKQGKKPESDDDIIFIPPPPIEVINVDAEELREKNLNDTVVQNNQKENQTIEKPSERIVPSETPSSSGVLDTNSKSKVLTERYNPKERREILCTPDSASNDFLENASIENNTDKFNFSLHGSDFNSAPAEFVVPAKPVETCETESSCSTNDLNRDFNNSVKSLVFSEVEFPRADIFSENNLESFGNFITPKRDAVGARESVKKSCGKAKPKKLEVNTSSDSSSSESDYETHVKALKDSQKLPNLSPMQDSEMVVRKKSKKTSSEFFKNKINQEVTNERKKRLKKRKTDTVETPDTESDSDSSVKVSTEAKKKQKKKQKLLNAECVTQVNKKKKEALKESTYLSCEKKKKTKSSDCDSNKSRIKKKKFVSDIIIDSSDENEEQIANIETGRKKKPKNSDSILNKSVGKKKNFSDISNSSEESSDPSQKKPKKIHLQCSTSEVEKKKKRLPDSKIIEVDDDVIADTGTKKKKKKRSSLSLESFSECKENQQTGIIEKSKKRLSKESESDDVSVEKRSKKRKKSCSTSSSKSLEVVDVSDIDEYIEIEILDEDHEQLTNVSKNYANNLEAANKTGEENPVVRDSASLEKNTKEGTSEIVKTVSERNTYCSTSSHFATITQTPVDQREDHDSDEEIVVDELDSNLSSLIVVDEVNCTAIDEEEIKVVSSSDSEFDFRDLTDVGNNIQLANCSSNAQKNDNSEEIIVVDDRSQSKFNNRPDFRRISTEFDIVAIHNSQTDDPESWKISHKDRILPFNTERNRGPRCNRCRQYGHNAIKCSEKRGPLKCSLCGDIGHQEPRCKKKICTQCGNEGDYSTTYCWKCFKFRNSVCRICNMRGHIAKMCPDLWRRYHLTTEEGPIVVPQRSHSEPLLQWCSGCAQQGHLEYQCNYIERQYPPMSPHIVSYEDVLIRSDLTESRTEDTLASSEGVFTLQNEAVTSLKQLPSTSDTKVSVENNSFSNISLQETTVDVSPAVVSQNADVPSKITPQSKKIIIISDERTNIAEISSKNKEETNVAMISSNLSSQVTSATPNLTCKTIVGSSSSEVKLQNANIASVSSIIHDTTIEHACLESTKDVDVVSVSSVTHEDPNIPSTSNDIEKVRASNIPYSSAVISLVSSSESSAESLDDLSSDEEGKNSVQIRKSTENKEPTPEVKPKPLEIVNLTTVVEDSSSQSSSVIEQEPVAVTFSNIRKQDRHINVTIIIRCMARESQYKLRRMLTRNPAKFRENLERGMNEVKGLGHLKDLEYFKVLLAKYDKLRKTTESVTTDVIEEQCFWLRIINMFVFGLHGYGQGPYHMGVLKDYLENTEENTSSKRSILLAYEYIFGLRKHKGTNYTKIINEILSKKE